MTAAPFLLSGVFLSGLVLGGIVVHAITTAHWREREHHLRNSMKVLADKIANMRTPINLDGDADAHKQIRERV